MLKNAINPLDGRYFEKTRTLAQYFSEEGLMKYRVLIEGKYLIALSLLPKTTFRKFIPSEIKLINNLYEKFDETSYKEIKKIETTTNHDVKAVEYFIKEKLSKTSLKDSLGWIHFALTSEDTNNIAYALILLDSLENVLVPSISEIISE
jgi:adenylosuccinate lyase